MKAYLVDPAERTIREIALDPAAVLKSLYKAIDCRVVEIVADEPIPGHDIWIDEEGFLYDEPPHGLLAILNTRQQIYAGRAVVTSHNDEGDTTAATCSIEDVARAICAVVDLQQSHVLAQTCRIIENAEA